MADHTTDHTEELNRLHEAQRDAAQTYTSQMLYLRHDMFPPAYADRRQLADEAAKEWLRLDTEIDTLNTREYTRWRNTR